MVVDGCPQLLWLVLLDPQEVLLDVDTVAEVRRVALAAGEDDQDPIPSMEGAEVRPLPIVVEAHDVSVKPYISPA